MGILDFIWGPKSSDTPEVRGKEFREQGHCLHTLYNVGFEQADINMYVTGGTGNSTSCTVSVEKGVLEILESSIREFIQDDYPFENIPVDPKLSREIPESWVIINPHRQIKSKVHKSDTEYVMKSVHHMGFAINLHCKADVIIEKVTFMYREVDGQLVDGPQMFEYTTPKVINFADEITHWIYSD
jgi:hypothetical protein